MFTKAVAVTLLAALAAAAPSQEVGLAKRAGATHVVTVAETGLTFSPNSITAATGDLIMFVLFPPLPSCPTYQLTAEFNSFEFASGGHSVTQSSFAAPCSYTAAGLDSGIVLTTPTSWTVTVESADPLWFSCRFVSSPLSPT
ncbi:hypothetical protein P7C70_g3275, partial [Phenoliferia sp. Uapishka_3]